MSICCNFCTYLFLSRQKFVQFEDASSRSESSLLNNDRFIVEILLFTVTETVLISEQITERRFGALLQISNIFSYKSNGFSYMILQYWLN